MFKPLPVSVPVAKPNLELQQYGSVPVVVNHFEEQKQQSFQLDFNKINLNSDHEDST